MNLFKYLFKELKNNKRFCILFVLNLSLGLTGFIALDGFKVSLDQTIKGRSKGVLGADFGISARRPINEKEQKLVDEVLGKNAISSKMVEMFSMVAGPSRRSRLTQVKVIEENFPFYGEIKLEKKGLVNSEVHKSLNGERRVWVYPELLKQLKVSIGDKIYIGETDFIIDDVVEEDSAAGISTNMAPRVYMNNKFLQVTGLVKPGSIVWHSKVYKLPGLDSEQLSSLRDELFKKIDNPDVRVYTHENVSSQVAGLVTRLNDFLGLASLVALFLAAVGSGFLFRSYFRKKTKEVATLLCLGASRQQAFSFYLAQILVLGFMSSVLATIFSFLLVPGLGALTQGLLPFSVNFVIKLSTVVLGIMVGTIGSLLICLPILLDLNRLKTSVLLSSQNPRVPFSILGFLGSSLPGVLMFWGLAVWLSQSPMTGSLFTGLFFLSGLSLALFSRGLFTALKSFYSIKNLSFKWAIRDLSRNQLAAMAGFVSIGMGALLLNIIPQLQESIQAELQRPDQSKIPSLFMFDIQEEQLTDFKAVIKKEGLSASQISPMVRARLKSVNDKEFDKGEGASAEALSREEEREMRFRNRGFNLSYREKLSESENIIEGQAFSGTFNETGDKLPEISLEKRFAERLGLKIGDKLTFDIESVPVEGEVINLRSVRWSSFQPNFFVQFQPGVLEVAPKTFIATLPAMAETAKYSLQDQIVERLPNISIVDVSRLVKRLSSILEQMSWALQFMSILCLIAGFVVIYSIANHQAATRKWDVGLLKTLGAEFGSVRGQFLWQFGILAFLATLTGALISLAMSYVLSYFLFDSLWAFNIQTPIFSIVGCTIISLVVTDLAIRSSLKIKARDLLSGL